MSVKVHMVTAGLCACGTSGRGAEVLEEGPQKGGDRPPGWGVPFKGWGGFVERGQDGRGEVGLGDGGGLFPSDFSQNSCWCL